jgi:ubiquitin C-terminal hydrolase
VKLGEKDHVDGKFWDKKLDQLEKKSWYLRLDERNDLPSIGLMNPSQLCYMSGALQLLFSIPLFRCVLYLDFV